MNQGMLSQPGGDALPRGFVEAYLRELDRVRGVTVRTASLVPDALWLESPAAGMLTVAELLGHVLDTERGIASGVGGGPWDFGPAREGSGSLVGEALSRPADDFAARSAEVRAQTAAVLRRLGETGLWAEVVAPFGYRGPALFLVDSIRENEVHHRGQVFIVLRKHGLKPPWLYGEEAG
jgi:uncharacterized damage-inducible protein DinB